MAQRKVTLSLPDDTVAAAQEAARQAHTSFSAYVTRALRNETLRRQLDATSPLGDAEWLDDIEADEEKGAA